jgi:putative transposase
MTNGTVRKGYHSAWQIPYHIVFPVKYRKALLDSEVTEIIKETTEGIAARYAIEMEAVGCDLDHPPAMWSSSEDGSWQDSPNI